MVMKSVQTAPSSELGAVHVGSDRMLARSSGKASPSRAPRVIFDVDGTLVDTNNAHARAWFDAFKAAGREVAFPRIRPLIGMGGDKLLRVLADLDHESPEGRAISGTRRRRFLDHYLVDCLPMRGARALLKTLTSDGVHCLVATSAEAAELNPILRHAGIEDLLHGGATSGDASRSKPDPDIVVAALRNGDVAPEHAVMIGDTPYDIAAARAAGVAVIGLRCGGWADDCLGGATAVFDDPADLLLAYAAAPQLLIPQHGT